HAPARSGRASPQADHGLLRVLRGLHDQRARGEERSDRQARRGLGHRPDHVGLRARRPRGGARHHLLLAVQPPGAGGPAPPPLPQKPGVRQKLGRIWSEIEVERYQALRTLTQLERGEHPGAGGSITKLSYSEFEKRFMELALEILGPYGQLTKGAPQDFALDI